MRSSLDLQRVAEAHRAVVWKRAAASFFPGLSVHGLRLNPARGSIEGCNLGLGELWSVSSPPVQLAYAPPHESDPSAHRFSVMLQLQGSTIAVQKGRTCELKSRDVCIIDEIEPFELEVADDFSRLMFLRMPRSLVLGRHPHLEHRTAEVFDAEEPGTALLRGFLFSLLDSADLLEDDQRAVALLGVAQLLGVPRPPRPQVGSDTNWRVCAALAYIDSRLADPKLTASMVAQAQGISRRWLDDILLKTVGTSLTAQIWTRRLTQAASNLQDPRQTSRTVTEIAFAAGFEDTAHFTRAFKRRYHRTPREWRRGLRRSS